APTSGFAAPWDEVVSRLLLEELAAFVLGLTVGLHDIADAPDGGLSGRIVVLASPLAQRDICAMGSRAPGVIDGSVGRLELSSECARSVACSRERALGVKALGLRERGLESFPRSRGPDPRFGDR